MTGPCFERLDAVGLNLQAVLDVPSLPAGVLVGLALTPVERARCRRLLVIGHLGQTFWAALQQRGMHGSDPVDQFVTEVVADWMQQAQRLHGVRAWRQVFPGSQTVGLQRLGALAGWHHPSPFGVGVHTEWGSWFAYRAVVLLDADWAVTPVRDTPAPCEACTHRACVQACPAHALQAVEAGPSDWAACGVERQRPGSACQDRCGARLACPVGATHQYTPAQTAYHYLQSMRAIRQR